MIMDNIINIVVIDSPVTKPVDTIDKINYSNCLMFRMR